MVKNSLRKLYMDHRMVLGYFPAPFIFTSWEPEPWPYARGAASKLTPLWNFSTTYLPNGHFLATNKNNRYNMAKLYN